ncbi:MAG: reverse transcriptase domain-containing protein, partial [Planctomycetota bacterium]
MRRATNLFERIPEYDNLRLAFHKAALGRRSQVAVRQFAAQLDLRIATLSSQLLASTLPIGRFQQFLIRDPTERVITAPCFEERVLHHAIMNVCEPVMDRWLIADTYACRVGLGREAAVQRAQQFSHRAAWFLKLDVRKYFDSVRHDRLLDILGRRFRDRRLLDLLERIIRGFRGAIGVGLPIGSLTSQHFANLYLGGFDRIVKETLRIRGYVRYMDDMVLWHSDRDLLRDAQDRCYEFAQSQLGLEFKPSFPRRSSAGLS